MPLGADSRCVELWHDAWLGPQSMLAMRAVDASEQRARFDGDSVQLPGDCFENAAAALKLARAAIAHIAAHKRYGSPVFAAGSLKPIQIALVSLVEDARVEQLAMRERPGLRRLWLPYHCRTDVESNDVIGLLRGLARALFNPYRTDPHPWIDKGRRLFLEHELHWDDPQISRMIGNLLGNDLGQMRLQFNWKTYVVEPAYRDDNSGLWDFERTPDTQSEELTALRPLDGGDQTAQSAQNSSAETVRAGERGETALPVQSMPQILSLPEWDYRLSLYRPQWVTLCEELAREASAPPLLSLLSGQRTQVAQLTALLRSLHSQRLQRRRRLREGDNLDLDACVEAGINRRAGLPPDPRVYMRQQRPRRELALMVLIDASQSTAAINSATGKSVLTLELEASALLAQALHHAGDAFSLAAFRSCGREDARIVTIKSFNVPWDTAAQARLAGVDAGLSTRLGAALRWAGAALAQRHARQRLLFVLSDGEPADIDSPDRRYLIEDARQAVVELARADVQTLCFGWNSATAADLQAIFGRGHSTVVESPAQLAAQLRRMFFRLVR